MHQKIKVVVLVVAICLATASAVFVWLLGQSVVVVRDRAEPVVQEPVFEDSVVESMLSLGTGDEWSNMEADLASSDFQALGEGLEELERLFSNNDL